MNTEQHAGWIVTNYGTPVYPTLTSMRRASIAKWLQGRPMEYWHQQRRKGAVRCARCSLKVSA